VPDDIRALADEYYEYLSRYRPTMAHMRGDYRFADRFEEASREAEDAHIASLREFRSRAEGIDSAGLAPQDSITREVLLFDAETQASLAEMRLSEFAVDPIFGMPVMAKLIAPMLSVPDAEVAAAMVDKYRGLGHFIDQMTERHRQGVAAGRVPAAFAVEGVIGQLDEWLQTPLDEDPLLATQVPPDFTNEEITRWREALVEVISSAVRPAVERQLDVLRREVAPASRPAGREGLMWVPDGELAYARAVERFTTLEMTPEEIHEIGLNQIERLAEEYRHLGSEVLGTDDLSEIFGRLRDDPELHHTSGEAIREAAEEAFHKARAAMGDWFGRLPQADCQIMEAPSGAQAFYFPPAEDGSRPGIFFMNTADPTSWGTFEVEATAFHEGIPGHHLQLAIATELGGDIPAFRRHSHIAAYGEGWALYTERLADEMGLYGSQLDRMGMLAADSMRACRLVVDTGIHALGWSRQDAIDYMASNSPLTLHTITEEVDRYIASSPGQALSYMIGRLEIQKMRAEAEAAMGDHFDIKGFHDTVLGSGPLPLRTLARLVSEWAQST
jgi:uncharacterized protein (DUF885 family)